MSVATDPNRERLTGQVVRVPTTQELSPCYLLRKLLKLSKYAETF